MAKLRHYDHLGNARVIVDDGGQTQYYAYYPFGELIESSGSHGTEFQFTGKERDKHVDFELDYFGARYYDPRVGSFTTIDKASQFASGYAYGANNPLIGVDRDGNLFWFAVPILTAAAYGAGASAVAYTAVGLASGADLGSAEFWRGFGTAALSGAISGSIGASLSTIGGSAMNTAASRLASNCASSAATSAITGQDVTLGGVAGSAAGSLAAGKLFGDYSGDPNNTPLQNTVDEVFHSGSVGMVSATVSTMTTNLARERPIFEGIGESMKYGFAAGAGKAAYENALFGLPLGGPQRESERKAVAQLLEDAGVRSSPVYRTGGLVGLASNLLGVDASGLAYGRNLLIFRSGRNMSTIDPTHSTWVHETMHYVQSQYMGSSRMQARALSQMHKYGMPAVYNTPHTLEWIAKQAERWYGPYY